MNSLGTGEGEADGVLLFVDDDVVVVADDDDITKFDELLLGVVCKFWRRNVEENSLGFLVSRFLSNVFCKTSIFNSKSSIFFLASFSFKKIKIILKEEIDEKKKNTMHGI